MNNERLVLLDIFRGLAVVLMIIIDAPPDFEVIYPILTHSTWEGLTIADLAFPFFVFAMGMSAALTQNFNLRKIIIRVSLLFILGLVFNIFSYLLNYFLFDTAIYEDLSNVRILGVLQRLALTYFFGILSCHMLKSNKYIISAAFFLLIISSLNAHIFSPGAPFDEMSNINRAIDIEILGEAHMYNLNGNSFDPEGLHGTINSVALMLFGFVGCRLITSKIFVNDEVRVFSFFGAVLLIVGGFWSCFDIISKPLWSTPYVLITAGINYIFLAIFSYLIERFSMARKILQPLAAFGFNPLFFYIVTNFTLILSRTLQFEDMPLYLWIWQNTIQGVVNPAFSAMLFTFLWCLLWLPFAEILYKRSKIIKI